VFRVPTSGGADKILKFFESELIPEIQKRYRIEPYRIFAGHSLSGLFALHALITKPELFQAYIAVSPSLEWDNEVVLRHLKDFLASRNQLKGTLFFTLSDEGVAVTRFNDDFEQLRQSLAANASSGFQWDSLVMKDEDHGSGVLRAHYAGLRKIFQDWRIPKNPTTQLPVGGLFGIEQHYSHLSRQLGYDVSAEKAIDDLGYQLMASNEAKVALVALKRNVELHPDSANAYNSLADCYEAMGEPEPAKRNVSKAIELARKENSSRLTEFQKHLETLTLRSALNDCPFV
jgi:tetratricopeptide (TPR) repeat protein